jgi:hypothetical protein
MESRQTSPRQQEIFALVESCLSSGLTKKHFCQQQGPLKLIFSNF